MVPTCRRRASLRECVWAMQATICAVGRRCCRGQKCDDATTPGKPGCDDVGTWEGKGVERRGLQVEGLGRYESRWRSCAMR